jgi:8-oxo-dGTP pyrophosphatase MutT (NUDIX family)
MSAAIDSPELRARLCAEFERHAVQRPEQAASAAEFIELLADPEAFSRERVNGHFTASAWLVAGDGERVLLTHHRKLQRWLQLGGHADGEADLAAVALREAEEESGLVGLALAGGIFDLDRHWIPPHHAVSGHWHFDVRYVVRAGASETFVLNQESLALAWVEIAALVNDPLIDESLRRMAIDWLQLPSASRSA